MKKHLPIIALIIIMAVLTYIGFEKRSLQEVAVTNASDGDKITALSTFTIIADMVAVVGGDKVTSISLTKPGAEIHGYQPTPDDLVQASKADVMFENGMNLEVWTEKLRASIPDVPVVRVSTNVEVQYIAEDAYAGKPNPHAWMSRIFAKGSRRQPPNMQSTLPNVRLIILPRSVRLISNYQKL